VLLYVHYCYTYTIVICVNCNVCCYTCFPVIRAFLLYVCCYTCFPVIRAFLLYVHSCYTCVVIRVLLYVCCYTCVVIRAFLLYVHSCYTCVVIRVNCNVSTYYHYIHSRDKGILKFINIMQSSPKYFGDATTYWPFQTGCYFLLPSLWNQADNVSLEYFLKKHLMRHDKLRYYKNTFERTIVVKGDRTFLLLQVTVPYMMFYKARKGLGCPIMYSEYYDAVEAYRRNLDPFLTPSDVTEVPRLYRVAVGILRHVSFKPIISDIVQCVLSLFVNADFVRGWLRCRKKMAAVSLAELCERGNEHIPLKFSIVFKYIMPTLSIYSMSMVSRRFYLTCISTVNYWCDNETKKHRSKAMKRKRDGLKSTCKELMDNCQVRVVQSLSWRMRFLKVICGTGKYNDYKDLFSNSVQAYLELSRKDINKMPFL
jgi:hypothetical protein